MNEIGPTGVIETIETAPKDGRTIVILYGPGDVWMRPVRWLDGGWTDGEAIYQPQRWFRTS